MSNTLLYQVYELKGLCPTDQSILNVLAFAAPKDCITVNIQMETIALRTKFAIRTIQYSLRRLEKAGYIVFNEGRTGGRGKAMNLDIVVQSSVAAKPVEEKPPIQPTNGHVPPPTNGHKPDVAPPRDPYKPDPLTPEQIAERRAKMEAARARIAAKPRPEKKYDRPGRTERESARMVSGEASLDGYPGGDETS